MHDLVICLLLLSLHHHHHHHHPQVQQLLGDPTNPEWLGYSVEFCGGTHIQNTAAAESFVLLGVMSV